MTTAPTITATTTMRIIDGSLPGPGADRTTVAPPRLYSNRRRCGARQLLCGNPRLAVRERSTALRFAAS
jgi:hypothetical protein